MVENILSDHTVAKTEADNFNKYLRDNHNISNFDVRVLNEALWPHEDCFDLQLPDQLTKLEAVFVNYFKSCNMYRFKNFKWAHLMSKITFTMTLEPGLPDQKYEWCDLTMNVLQGVIMYMIYQRRPYKVHQNEIISSFTTVPKQLVLDNLNSLVTCCLSSAGATLQSS